LAEKMIYRAQPLSDAVCSSDSQ